MNNESPWIAGRRPTHHHKPDHASLDITIPTPPWMDEALCAQADPELWFPEVGEPEVKRVAAGICAVCPVRTQCLTYALETGERHGVWGGLTPGERRRVIDAGTSPADVAPRVCALDGCHRPVLSGNSKTIYCCQSHAGVAGSRHRNTEGAA